MTDKLRRELKMSKPFDSLEQEAAIALARTHDRIQIAFVRLFREYGITPAQYNILRILRGAREPLPSLEIADRLITTVPGITGLIDRLERLALVCRQRDDQDRRVVWVGLTAEGRSLLKQLESPVKQLHRTLLGHMTAGELRTLVDLLDKARALDAE